MNDLGKNLKVERVKVRIYDLFDGIEDLWVNGIHMERVEYNNFGCYEFLADTMMPYTICVSNNLKKSSTIAAVETFEYAEVCLRGDDWGVRTRRVSLDLAEFQFRALEGANGVMEVCVAVNKDMCSTK